MDLQNTTKRSVLFFAAEHDLDYLPAVAALCPELELAAITRSEASFRLFARDAAKGSAACTFTKYESTDGEGNSRSDVTVQEAVTHTAWDVVVLGQELLASTMYGSYNTDLEFLLDYLADLQPGARVFLNMPWAWQQDASGPRATDFATYFENSQAVMYNAIVTSMEYAALGSEARFGHRLAGMIPVGAAIQSLRRVLGDCLCEDGLHLSHRSAKMAAAYTVARTLCPDVSLVKPEGEEQSAACRAADFACTHDLVRLAVPRPVRVEDVSDQGDVTVAQATAPYKLHFPDSAVTADGTIFVSAYEQVYHYPERALGERYGWQGSGRLVIWKSSDNGLTFDTEHPVLVIDERQLDRWGVARTADRYRRWKAGEDYIFNADPRDPNFSVVWADINGDGEKEEVLIYTFCMVDYHEEHQTHSLNLCWSVDGGRSWSVPQELNSEHSPALIKRGDAAVFSDGQMLVPTYFRNKIVLLLMEWSVEEQKWVVVHDTVLPDPAPEKTGGYEYNELSFVAPDPAGDEVYGFIRANAAVIRSEDRGRTWRLVGMEDGYIHQPGFTPLDRERAFVTWARIASPRTVYGKVFYYRGSWSDTVPQVVYPSPDTSGHDMADPSCRLLQDGRIYTVSYDTAYRSIVGSFCDPNSSEFAPVEMDRREKQALLYKTDGPVVLPLTIDQALPASYTLSLRCTIATGGSLDVKLSNGTTITFDRDLPVGECALAVLVLGGTVYTQVNAGTNLQYHRWRWYTAGEKAQGKITLSGVQVQVEHITLTHRVNIQMDEELVGIVGGTGLLQPVVRPISGKLSWRSDNEAVALVEDGQVRYVGVGDANIILQVDGAEKACAVHVAPLPMEVAGEGERRELFRDSYEAFPVGENSFWTHMEQGGYRSCGMEPTRYSAYDIEETELGRSLKLTAYNGKRTWHKVDLPIRGDYTASFHFKFTGGRTTNNTLYPGHCLYINLWQDSGIHGFVDLTPEGIRCEYQAENGEVVNDPELFGEEICYPLNVWHTARLARVSGSIFVKVWVKDRPEPENWDMVCMRPEYRTDNAACFRMQYYAGGPEPRSVYIDNLVLSQHVDEG